MIVRTARIAEVVQLANRSWSATERLEIAELVKANGAIYEGDLTRQITHLISFRTEGDKYKAAKNWGLHIVSIEWLRDSLERGMILEEKLYDPALPPEERGKGAWDRTKPKRTSPGKRSRDDSSTSLDGGRRKLRRTASTKLGSQNESIWGDIVGGGMVAQVARSGVWEANNDQAAVRNESTSRRQSDQGSSMRMLELTADHQPSIQGVFSGCRFYLEGFGLKKSSILSGHLTPHGADVAGTLEDLLAPRQNDLPLRLFRIVPSDLPISKHSPLPESHLSVETITEWWVELCLHHKKFMEPTENVIGRPFPKFPIEGFREIIASSAAFTGIDLLHVTRAVKLLGGTYSEFLTPKSSVLITKSVEKLRKDKFDYAQEYKIPIVNAAWLWDSISVGMLLPFQKYRCRLAKRTESLSRSGSLAVSKEIQQHGRSKSEISKSVQRSDSHSSNSAARPPRNLGLDTTAFTADEPVAVKEEDSPSLLQTLANASNSSTKPSTGTEPLAEINNNSPTRTVSTASAPENHPAPRPQAEINSAISNLLAKTKSSSKHPDESEPTEGRKRGANRILGRAASNVSTASTHFSRASSVDSTATHGRPVEYPSNSASGPSTTNEQVEKFLDASNDRNIDKSLDSQPPMTQLQYEDPESKEYQEMVQAKMRGEKFEIGGKRTGLKEKSITLGDIAGASGVHKGRSKRERAPPGFR
jgi:DNA replication regulator DPB11